VNTQPPKAWLYRLVSVERVVDGDTLFLRVERPVDFGFRRRNRESSVEEFRLALSLDVGIDCPESKGPTLAMGQIARARVIELLGRWTGGDRPERLQVASWGESHDKYGRWLGDVRVLSATAQDADDADEWEQGWEQGAVLWTLAQRLVDEGYALAYDGSGPRPRWDPAAPYPLVKGAA
jgi:endonuclease YncB( thermonuclease family)